jgi:hypothetical protein
VQAPYPGTRPVLRARAASGPARQSPLAGIRPAVTSQPGVSTRRCGSAGELGELEEVLCTRAVAARSVSSSRVAAAEGLFW